MTFFKTEWKKLLLYITVFLVIYHLPIGKEQFDNAVLNSINSLNSYFKEHFLFGLFPAMFIAGAISIFLNSNDVMKYMGAKANKIFAYFFASISGLLLSVCSCTVMPLFAGVYQKGAGLGPAITFLFAAPAINLVALTMTTSVLGLQMGIARTVMAFFFSFFIGIFMSFVFKNDEIKRIEEIKTCCCNSNSDNNSTQKPFYVNLMFFISMIALFVLLNMCHRAAYLKALMIIVAVLLIFTLIKYFKKDDYNNWFGSTFDYVKRMVPLLVIGIMASGFLLGYDGKEGIIPTAYINTLIGGNGLLANFISSFLGAFMYFCTLIEVPIVQGLMNNGMGKGPALALLLAGPALSLPNMLLIRSVLGTKKTAVYIGMVIILATLTGYVFGNFF
jgi:uncharacterized membrane protein YraQ (UPF0718 family)